VVGLGMVRQIFCGKMSCLRVGQESGRGGNGTPKFRSESVVSQSWREEWLTREQYAKSWRENVVSQSWVGKCPSREGYVKILAGKCRVSKLGGKVAGAGTVRQGFGGKQRVSK
jgi:hypothetical protein